MKPRASFRMPPRLRSGAAIAVASFSSAAALGDAVQHPPAAIESVQVEVVWVDSRAELEAKRREYGTPRPASGVIRETLEAFSVLGRREGVLVCLIFAPPPARFDDDVKMSLGHELLHCLGFSYCD